MRIASIDIGTNTILLLIAEIDTDGSITTLHDEQVIARLGKGVDANRNISRDTFSRAGSFLSAYKYTCDQYSVDTIVAVGTSALRDARNGDDFIDWIRETTGIQIEVLSGDDEARWTYRGALTEFPGSPDRCSVIDIGGGSTELITGSQTAVHTAASIDIGSVRITERFLADSPPDPLSLANAHDHVRSQLEKQKLPGLTGSFAIGVAGTVTTLAAVHKNIPYFSTKELSGVPLGADDIRTIFGSLKGKSADQLRSIPQITSGRADIILAGILILMTVMEVYGLRTVNTGVRGLRYGIAIREFERRNY
jgi:exopolyphosphatase/guanosine-5'-triphosphate,3'-diphosphate pyrophosphatase